MIFGNFWGRYNAILELNVYSWTWTKVPIIMEIAFRRFSFFLDSSLSRLEPKLQLFEVDDHGDAGNDDLSHHHLQNFKQS